MRIVFFSYILLLTLFGAVSGCSDDNEKSDNVKHREDNIIRSQPKTWSIDTESKE